VQQVELAGYYPELVLDTLRLATGEEDILSGMVQSETTFAEAVHRHLTVLALTPSRLIIVHVDDTPRDDGSPGALATSEAVPLSRIRSMALTRGVADPARGGGTLTEMTIAVSWGSVRRIDMEPATCGDPDCQADHGMTGVAVPDDGPPLFLDCSRQPTFVDPQAAICQPTNLQPQLKSGFEAAPSLAATRAFSYPFGRFLSAIRADISNLVFCHNETKVRINFVTQKRIRTFADANIAHLMNRNSEGRLVFSIRWAPFFG